jgi:signal transduction histidine kinase
MPGTAEERLQRILRIGELLERTARSLGPALDLTHTVRTVLRAMRDLVDFRGGSIALVEGNRIRLVATDPPASDEVMRASMPVGTGLLGRVVLQGEPVWSDDLDHDDRVDPELRRLGSNAAIHSFIAVPLIAVGDVVGALQIDSEEVNAFTEDDLRLLQWLAIQVGGAIEGARRFEQIAELERLQSNLVDQVSHELRTPLTIIQGFISVLRESGESLSDEDRSRFLERLDGATDRLAHLIEELLRFARLERGALRPSPERAPLAAVLTAAAETSIDPKRVTVRCAPDVTTMVDPTLLGEAVGLLLDNALKYGNQAEVVGTDATIEIIDRGEGLPDRVRTVAFEAFTRGHLEVPGMGVGLTIARTLVDVSGGSLRLEADPGGGTRAVIDLRPASPGLPLDGDGEAAID